MATVIRIGGTSFPSTAPKISKLVRDGLVGAWRPAGSAASLIDLSGSGATLVQRGTPTWTSRGVVGNGINGFATSVPESLDCTIMCVARTLYGSTHTANPIGSYNNAITPGRGMSIFTSSAAGTGGGLIDIRIQAQSFYRKTSDGTYITTTATQLLDDEVSASIAASSWYFAALVVDATANKTYLYVPAKVPGAAAATINYATLGSPGLLSDRILADPTSGNANKINLLCNNTFSGTWTNATSELAEGLVYDRALSFDEVMEQYALSKAYFAAQTDSIAI